MRHNSGYNGDETEENSRAVGADPLNVTELTYTRVRTGVCGGQETRGNSAGTNTVQL